MRKKAQVGESMLWLYRFIMIIIIVGGIIFVVVKYYSDKQDVRPLEASLLSGKIISCLKPSISQNFNQERIQGCINIDNEIAINLTFENKNISLGDSMLSSMCELKERNVQGKHFPYCLQDSYIFVENNQEKILNLSIAIQKVSQNV